MTICGIDAADFEEKTKKRKLERDNAKLITEKGGWFGIPGPAVATHLETYERVLRQNSPILLAESDQQRYLQMSCDIEAYLTKHYTNYKDRKVFLLNEDIFMALQRYDKAFPSPAVAPFRYGHLDFCKTATVLIRDHKLHDSLLWLAKWKKLKSPFYLDLTVTIRNERNNTHNVLMDYTIPNLFNICGWDAYRFKRSNMVKGSNFSVSYRDGAPMQNAFYCFVRRKKRKRTIKT